MTENTTTVTVYAYTVEDRDDATYVFADAESRDRFALAVFEAGGTGYTDDLPLIHRGAMLDDLIEQELAE